MKSKTILVVIIILMASLLLTMLPGCTPVEAADSYTAILPSVLPAGSEQTVSVALFKSNQTISGKGSIVFKVPDVDEGVYKIRVQGEGFSGEADVKIENTFLVFLETDKPIY